MLDLIYQTRDDAQKVLDALRQIINTYGHATVSDLKSLTGLTSTAEDEDRGWKNLDAATIEQITGGWIIKIGD